MPYVVLDAGDCPIGSGQRYCVVTLGRKKAHVYYPPTCTGFTIDKRQYERMKPRALIPGSDFKPKWVRKLIRAKRKQFEALGVRVSGVAASRALSTLKEDV